MSTPLEAQMLVNQFLVVIPDKIYADKTLEGLAANNRFSLLAARSVSSVEKAGLASKIPDRRTAAFSAENIQTPLTLQL